MSGPRIHLTDDLLHVALMATPGRDTSVELARDIADLIRVTPQHRRLLAGRVPALPIFDMGRLGRVVWLVALTTLLLAAALFIALIGSRPNPAPMRVNGVIAFGSDRLGLLLADPVTRQVRQFVAPWPTSASGPTNRSDLIAWSPDGDRLSLISTGATSWSIGIVSAQSGASLGRVVGENGGIFPERGLQWSNDGSKLILAGTDGGLPAVAVADLGSGEVYRIGGTGLSYDPAVSPTAPRVVFVETSAPFTDDYRLVITDERGRGEKVLLSSLAGGATVEGAPHWSPDGRRLVLTIRNPDGTFALARIEDDGRDPAVISPSLNDWIAGVWSPDGSTILAIASPQGGRSADVYTSGDQRGALYTLQPDGSGWQAIAPRVCANAAWAPDGTAVVFESGACEQPMDRVEVRAIDPHGSNERVLWTGDARSTGRISLDWQALPAP
jgi:Tol biopolymer transport system component